MVTVIITATDMIIMDTVITVTMDTLVINFWRILMKFSIVAGGGTLLGLIFGFLGSFAFRVTEHYRLIEPLLLFTICYLSYLTAEMMDLSAILSIIFCSFVMMHRCVSKVSVESHLETGLKFIINILPNISPFFKF